MLGAIAGDIIGSTYEFTEQKRYDFELLPQDSRFTDDTVMTLAVAWWLVDSGNRPPTKERLVECMQTLGRRYPYAGYGSIFNFWLHCDDPQPYNSWGNGSAMRVSPVGLYADSLKDALELAEITASVSHNHPEGIKGAQAVAAAIWMAKNNLSKDEIRQYIETLLGYDLSRTVEKIRPTYQWEVSCQQSVPESIICFLDGRDFEDVVRLAVSLGGDADTMACIAGSIAACVYPIPEHITVECEKRLTPDLFQIMRDFEQFINDRSSLCV